MNINSNTYSEVYAFFGTLGYNFIKKIPEIEYCKILEKRNPKYNPIYNLSDFKDDRKLTREAQYMILGYYYRYCCKTEEEKNKVMKIIKEKEIMLNKTYNNIFENKRSNSISETIIENQIADIDKKNFIRKIIDFIKAIFKQN